MIKRIFSNLAAVADLQLQAWFPPVLDVTLDATSRQYHDRINRTGVFRLWGAIAGVTVVRVVEGQSPPPLPAPGTKQSRALAL